MREELRVSLALYAVVPKPPVQRYRLVSAWSVEDFVAPDVYRHSQPQLECVPKKISEPVRCSGFLMRH